MDPRNENAAQPWRGLCGGNWITRASTNDTPTRSHPQFFRPRLAALPAIARSTRAANARVNAARADLRDAERIARDVANRARVAVIGRAIAPDLDPDLIHAMNEEVDATVRMVRDAKARLDRALARREQLRRRVR